jgi:hypothetical protein
MLKVLPAERYDPGFRGQYLQTTYLDTPNFDLRKARLLKDRYLTLRIRCYSPSSKAGGDYPQGSYALSAKTESAKFRVEMPKAVARLLLDSPATDLLSQLLPADLYVRLLDLSSDRPLVPVVTVCAVRYAVEDAVSRFTLDTEIKTDTGKWMPYGILELKSTRLGTPLGSLGTYNLRPVKLSKFLWATEWK